MATAQTIEGWAERATALAAVGRGLHGQVWTANLHASATRTRRDLVVDLGALAPVIEQIGGKQAVAETVQAVQAVGRWWP